MKETRVCLKLINRENMIEPINKIVTIMQENEELIAILSKSINTAKTNNN